MPLGIYDRLVGADSAGNLPDVIRAGLISAATAPWSGTIRASSGADFDTLTVPGAYNTWTDTQTMGMPNAPVGTSGILIVRSWGSYVLQMHIVPNKIFVRMKTNTWSPWSVYASEPMNETLLGITHPGQTSPVQPVASYMFRVPFKSGSDLYNLRLRFMNYDERDNVGYSAPSLKILAAYIGEAELDANGDVTGNFVSPPFRFPSSELSIPDSSEYWTGVLSHYSVTQGKNYLLSMAYTSAGTGQMLRQRAGMLGNASAGSVGNLSGGTLYRSVFTPLNIRLEGQTNKTRAVVIGDSHSVGSGASNPSFQSPWSFWALRSGVCLENVAEHGSATPQWQDPAQFKWTQYANKGDVLIYWLGQNDIYGSSMPNLETLKTNTLKIWSNARKVMGVKRIYAATLMPRNLASTTEQETLRKDYNSWLLGHPGGIDGVYDVAALVTDSATGQVRSEYISVDGLHLNSAGCAYVGMNFPSITW